ncbi:MAG: ATP-binding protein [Atopobiaceae bacterium]|nr:ATP-binding protein [Olsenella sp.]MBQ6491406.1 ATP-binding protein [Atopobiaceae bacterium]
MSDMTISLSVPAQPAFARSVRMMAANLAVIGEMTVDDVEDARMVAEEGFVCACATAPATCDIVFTVSPGELAMDFSLGAEVEVLASADAAVGYSALLLSAVCDEYVVDPASSVLHLVKRAVA